MLHNTLESELDCAKDKWFCAMIIHVHIYSTVHACTECVFLYKKKNSASLWWEENTPIVSLTLQLTVEKSKQKYTFLKCNPTEAENNDVFHTVL